MAIANNVDLTTVSRLYTAFFNRAPDTAGLSFWANALANGASVSTVTQGFLTAPEGVAQYPAFQNGEQFISAFYTKVFGRAADAEGLAFWSAALNNLGGAESNAAKAAVASQIISVVSTPLSEADAALPANAQTVQDRALFANKVEIGTYLATNAAVSEEDAGHVFGGTYPAGSSPITADIASVDEAKSAFFDAQIADGTIANVVGSDANDVFTIDNLGTYVGRTLDGGKGIDTLILDGTIGTPAENQVKNVEIVRFVGASGSSDVSKFVGSTDISVTASTAALTGLADKKLAFLNDASTVTADYGDTATTAAIVLNSKDTDASNLTLAGSKLSSATVSGTGAITVSGPAALTTLNVASTGTIILAASTVGTIDASTSTGAVTAEVGANQVYKGGSGIDTVVLSATPSKAITGGAGDNDVLVVNGEAATVVLNAGITGFETLGFGDKATGAYDTANFKNLLVSNEVAGALIANNVAAGTDVTFTTSPDATFTYNLANKDGTSDAVNVKLSAAAPIQVAFEAAGVETVNITSTNTATGDASHGVQLLASDATSVVVTGNAGLELQTTAGKITNFDASAVTGNVGVKYQSTNETVNASVTIKGSLTGANELAGNDATNDTIIGGAGDDLIIGTAGKDVLTGGAGDDTFVLAPNNQAVTGGSSQIFTTITDAAQGDTLSLGGLSESGIFTETTLNQITSVETATYADFLDLATTGNAAASSIGSWFQVGGDTYIVVDNSADATFVEGTDQVVKLTGLVDVATLTVDLSVA